MSRSKLCVGSVFILPLALALAPGFAGYLFAQEPFLEGIEGELYYCPRIDLNPPKDGGPLTITLDGVLDEEAWARAAFQHYARIQPDRSSPEDFDLQWAAVADRDFLYIAWQIVDDTRVVGETSLCDVWKDDSIELYLDAHNDGPVCPGATSCYAADDAQLSIGADQIGKFDPIDPDALEFGGVAGKGSCDFTGAAPELLRGVCADLESGPGWQGEVAIALDTMGNGSDGTPEWHIDPSHGTVIGFSVQANDDDNGGDRDKKLIWAALEVQESAWQNPGAFGKLQFIVPGKAIATITRDLPDGLTNGGSGTASLKVSPIQGTGTVVISEKMPPGLSGSAPSAGGVLAGDTITWDLGLVDAERTVSYTVAAAPDAIEIAMPGTAVVDGELVSISGDTTYTGAPISIDGFIKLWNHLGPLAWASPPKAGDHGDTPAGSSSPGACNGNGGAEIGVDWIVNADASIDQLNILPFPGQIVRPAYGGDGAGNGARAAGLTYEAGDSGRVSATRFPVWHTGLSAADTVDHANPDVHGFDADDHCTLSSIYVTNHTLSPIDTAIGFGSDDSIQVFINDVDVTFDPLNPNGGLAFCGGYGASKDEPNVLLATLPVGESRVLVKVLDGTGGSGFRLRFRKDPNDPAAGGLVSPDITVSPVSVRNPIPGSLTRSFGSDTYAFGGAVVVSLAASLAPAADVTIREVLPAGALADQISDGGHQAGDTIEWKLNGLTTKTVTYQLNPGSCLGDIQLDRSSFLVGANEVVVGGKSRLTRTYANQDLGSWLSRAVGTPTSGSAERIDAHAVKVSSTSAGIIQKADNFQLVSTPAPGDFDLHARIDCLNDPAGKGLAGLIVRNSDAPDSASIHLGVTTLRTPAGDSLILKGGFRSKNGASLATIALKDDTTVVPPILIKTVNSLPIYLQIQRTGDTLVLGRSDTGVPPFTPVATKKIGTDIILQGDVLTGLVVYSGADDAATGRSLTSGNFSEVSGPEFPTPLPAPNAPQNLAATAGDRKVDLAWSDPAAGGGPFTAFAILRDGAKVGEVAPALHAYSDTGLTNDQQYCYTVKAIQGSTLSAASNQSCATPKSTGVTFRRGDVDGNGKIEVTDAIGILGHLFLGDNTAWNCPEAADTDNDTKVDVTDAVNNLNFQFLGGTPPAAPGPRTCGPDDGLVFLGCNVACQ